jgi:hypothetical protein
VHAGIAASGQGARSLHSGSVCVDHEIGVRLSFCSLLNRAWCCRVRLNRRGGNAILYHRHLKPVINREWAPPMDGITANITASGSTIEFGPKIATSANLGVV